MGFYTVASGGERGGQVKGRVNETDFVQSADRLNLDRSYGPIQ